MKKLLTRIFGLLTVEERREGIKVVLSVFVNALMDFFSIAALLPILYFLMDGTGERSAALPFCGIAMAVCLLKYLVGTRLLSYQNKYTLGIYKRLSFALYSSYFNRGLLYIRTQGVSRLGYEVNALCYSFSRSILGSILKMAADSLLIILVLAALLVYSPVMVLILLLSFIPFVLVYVFIIRKKAKLCGEQEMLAKREQARVVSDTFGGYADLQVQNAFPQYSRQFEEGVDSIVESRMKMENIIRLPLLLSEAAVVVGLTVLALFGDGDVRMLIGVFAVAAFRLLPAVRAILSGWTSVQNSGYSLDMIEEGLKEVVTPQEEELDFTESIVFDRLSYSYPDGGRVLEDFNLKIDKGEYIGFRGDSGAGKSTLFNLLLGFLPADEGGILIDGHALSDAGRRSWLGKVGYVPQDVFIFKASLAENISLGAGETDRERVDAILRSLNMGGWLDALPEGLDTSLGERGGRLSGGQRQRIGIARALYRDISVLLLDEATSSLDNENEREILEIISGLRDSRKDLTILSIAHRDSSLVRCDRIINI